MNTYNETHELRFVGLSGLLHVAAFFIITTFAVDMLKKTELPPIVEFEVVTTPRSAVVPLGEQLNQPTAKEVSAPAKKPTKSVSKTVAKLVAKVPSHSQTVAQEPLVAPPLETVDLEEAPEILAAPAFQDSLVDEDLDKIDKEEQIKTAKAVALMKKESDKKAQEQAKAQAIALLEAEKEQQAEEQRLADEKQQREKDREAKNQQAKALAAAAALAAAEKANQTQSNNVSGVPNGVRSLDQLRQAPGNKRPEYDNDDRFHQRQGAVAFYAYITKQGNPVEFKLVQSSGHRSLDIKTLKTLKSWRFQPGQEGWVEIPFKWDLKGGPQEMPTGLRRNVGRN